MKSKITWCFALGLLFLTQLTFAQQKTISGTVTDQDGLVLPGVNIVIKGTSSGTQTDFDGNYSVNVNAGQTLVFTFVGLKTEEVTVGSGQTVINLAMELDADTLEEVVVQGYRTSTKEKSSIASVTISAQSIENRPNASFVQTLSGQVAGLNITTNSGQPGANSTVTLRGINSINGNIEPLFIIDGTPVDEDNFRSLNPQDIASISVLKDAGATAIYGNRGANGVVVIETRQGSFNQPLRINATSILSFNTLQKNDYNGMNASQQLALEKEYGTGRGAGLSDAEIAAYETFDWTDFFFRTGLSKNNTVSFTSGGDKSSSFTSLGFLDTEGILKSSGLKRFTIRQNINGRSENDRFSYGLNLSANYSKSDEPNSIGSGAINRNYVLGAFSAAPYVNIDEYTSGRNLALERPLDFALTPLYLYDRLLTYTRFEEEVKAIASFNAAYKLTNNLSARMTMGGDYTSIFLTRAEGPTSFNAFLFGGDANPTAGFQSQLSDRVFSFNQVTSLNYNKTWGKHTIDAGAYVEYFKAHYRYFGFTEEGLDPKTFFPGDGSGFIADNTANDLFSDTVFADILNSGLFSYFSQVDYDYDARYGVAGTIRRDASYRFADSNKWATFYSISGRWNIGNESFMEGSVFDALKVRASYGTAGNQRIAGGSYFTAPDLTRSLFATGAGYAGVNSLSLSQIGNNTLRWETVRQTDIGLDFEIFNRRLRGSFDYYWKTTEDLFQDRSISAVNSVTSLRANIGNLYNEGFDFTLNYDVIRGGVKGFNLGVNLVGNYNKTELGDIPTSDGIANYGRSGGILNEYRSVRYAGVNPANGQLLYYTADGELTENPDLDNDRVFLDKNIYPDLSGSFGFSADYKGFFLQTQWNYVVGVDRYDFDLAGLQDPSSIGQFRSSTDLLRAWTPDNRNTDIPSLFVTNDVGGSDRYLRSADYLRLRFASFGYSFPKEFIGDAGISSLRIFANAENFITISKWRGYDPETQSNGSRNYPTPKTVSFGIELGL